MPLGLCAAQCLRMQNTQDHGAMEKQPKEGQSQILRRLITADTLRALSVLGRLPNSRTPQVAAHICITQCFTDQFKSLAALRSRTGSHVSRSS